MSKKASRKRDNKRVTKGETDAQLERLRNMSDDDIDYSDIPATDAEFWKDAELVEFFPKEMISIRIDPDVLAWYRSHAKRYQTLMNAVLRKYKEAREQEERSKR